MTGSPRWISEADVVQLMHLGDAIEALTRGLLEGPPGICAHWTKPRRTGARAATCMRSARFSKVRTCRNEDRGNTLKAAPPLFLIFMGCNHREAVGDHRGAGARTDADGRDVGNRDAMDERGGSR